jgi:glutathione peroxidase-family protein
VKKGGTVARLPVPDERRGCRPNWNFCKYLVGKNGRVLKFWKSHDAGGAELRSAVDAALASK